jgi:eukaryotic-like serine/threonine-protein kinase
MAGLLALPQPGDVVGGKYLLESVVDRCEFGAVFAARHRQTGRRFALRWLAGTGAGHALAEVSAQAPALAANGEVIGCFQHPFVLSPIDFGRTKTARYLVMEWLDGETLAAYLKRHPKLPLADAARILVPCMRSLHEAHLAGVVHGELRPGNVFICSGGNHQAETVRVFDYSLARPLQPVPLVTDAGQYTRHAYYMAPEQITGGGVDRKSDVYAFGVILYRALTGFIPFSSEHPDEFARWIYSQDPPVPQMAAGLTPATYRLLMQAMAREPMERFDSCNDLANAVETVVRNPGLQEVNMPNTPSGFRRAPKRASHVATMRLPGPVTVPPSAAPAAAQQPESSVRTVRVVMEHGTSSTRPPAPKKHIPTQPLQLIQPLPVDLPQLASSSSYPGPIGQPLPPAPQPTASQRPAADREWDRAREDVDREVYEARAYERPWDRRMLVAAACFAVVGVIPLAAYYTPAVERPDATLHEEILPRRRVAAEPTPPLVPARRAAPAVQQAPAQPQPPRAALKDDPNTPLIDESDPLIAAALAAIRQKPAAEPQAPAAPVSAAPAPAAAKPRAARSAAAKPARPVPSAAAPAPAAAAAAAPKLPTVDVKAPAVLQIPDFGPQSQRTGSKPAAQARPRADATGTAQPHRSKDMNLF